jgi:carboxypeptidase Q
MTILKQAIAMIVAAMGTTQSSGCASSVPAAAPSKWAADTQTPRFSNQPVTIKSDSNESGLPASLQSDLRRIVAMARQDRGAYQKLAYLTDQIGRRLSGSGSLDRALTWAADTMKRDGHENVVIEPVMVPHWVRGAESAELVTPLQRSVRVLGLGGTVAGDVTGPVMVVSSWQDLEQRKAQAAGAIVLFNVAMPTWTEVNGSGYGDVVPYRGKGAIEAAKLGAVAVLVRSVTARSLATLHTGAMRYVDEVKKIPAAAVSVEDAEMLARMTNSGPVTMKLQLQSQKLPDVKSGNVIGEIRGSQFPDQIVLIGAHIDSWDVGQGAHDDGAGCVHMMQALTIIRKLGLKPKRTIRVVLFTNEENGVRGAKAYSEAHVAELSRHVAAMESDSGGFAPLGFELEMAESSSEKQKVTAMAYMKSIAAAIPELHLVRNRVGHSGTDVEPLVAGGAVGIGLGVDGRTYFDIHHTDADTLDKVDPATLADGVAAVAAMAFALADMPESIRSAP